MRRRILGGRVFRVEYDLRSILENREGSAIGENHVALGFPKRSVERDGDAAGRDRAPKCDRPRG